MSRSSPMRIARRISAERKAAAVARIRNYPMVTCAAGHTHSGGMECKRCKPAQPALYPPRWRA